MSVLQQAVSALKMPYYIDRVDPGSAAEQAGAQVDDLLVSVNGISVLEFDADGLPELAGRLPKDEPRTLILQRGGGIPGAPTVVVRGKTMGLSLWDKEPTLSYDGKSIAVEGGVYVTDVAEGSAAASCGARMWDTLVSVDGTSVRGMNLDEVGDIFSNLDANRKTHEFCLERHPSGNITNAPTSTVVLRCSSDQSLGVAANRKIGGGDDLFIDFVDEGGRGMLDGAVLGDLLMSVNGASMRGAQSEDLSSRIAQLPAGAAREFVLVRPRSDVNVDVEKHQFKVVTPAGKSMGFSVVYDDWADDDSDDGQSNGRSSSGDKDAASNRRQIPPHALVSPRRRKPAPADSQTGRSHAGLQVSSIQCLSSASDLEHLCIICLCVARCQLLLYVPSCADFREKVFKKVAPEHVQQVATRQDRRHH